MIRKIGNNKIRKMRTQFVKYDNYIEVVGFKIRVINRCS